MKVLLVKTSSLGDVVHALPAVNDAFIANPDLEFHWLVESGFQEIPSWHPAVTKVIPISWRKWRQQPLQNIINGTFKNFIKQLRQEQYDLIIDAQGLVKSSIFASLAKGKTVGMDWNSAREQVASILYKQKFNVMKSQHAVLRLRQLFAAIFNYQFADDKIDYGIKIRNAKNTTESEKYMVFLHGTTWETKHWPPEYWIKLAIIAKQNGFKVLLPWGSEAEKQRATTIAKTADAMVLPRSTLTELAVILQQAAAVVAVDTGLGHITAALGVPTISLYGPTNPRLSGTYGNNQLHQQADFKCAPCLRKKCNFVGAAAVFPACFATVSPELVWDNLQPLLQGRSSYGNDFSASCS